ncbi:PIN domain-containing protein [Xenococcus sp. PCC 7305]|uniref:type II toxin-antitoxin system VapC family toxin n=1 Tax=Xenococcus sp. PCC 7305 TaxID=102125 RepID=UPI0002AC30E5|nr:type II toxin-antitoxin system VapC family toxin [Xenococcus sp. PCC 7305]ELS00331.1 PIN domain-containing protein [Xenococcus sp. PCC 7305]
MIVTDTNVIAYLFLEGERTKEAESVLLSDPEWVAPYLWRSEFRNILALYIRKSYLQLDDASYIMQEAEALMLGKEFEMNSKQILDLVKQSRCSAYDCEYVALAQKLEINLVTADRKILSEFPSIAVSLSSFK